jgi:hypothetical protein
MLQNIDKKRFQHDCEKCRWIGHFYVWDVYRCSMIADMWTIILRAGDEGHEYMSFPYSIHNIILNAGPNMDRNVQKAILLARLLLDSDGSKDGTNEFDINIATLSPPDKE